MNISIFGTGYVGLVTGACLAPPGLAFSRRSLRSLEGGFEDVRDVFSGR